MRIGLPLSILTHAGVVFTTFVALPEAWRPDVSPPVIVPVDMITIGEVTEQAELRARTPEPVEEEPEPEPEPVAEEPAPEPEPELASELQAPEPEPVDDGVPALPEPEPEEPPAPAEELVVEPKAEPLEPEKAQALKPRVKPQRREELDFSRLSALIDRADDEEPRERPREAPAEAPPPEEGETEEVGAARLLTLSEEDALRARMYSCWTLPGGGGGAEFENKVVSVRIRLNRDGTLNGPPDLINQNRIMGSGDAFLIAAAESAQRAVLKCAPYDFLPMDKYESWKEITMRFDPSDMLAR